MIYVACTISYNKLVLYFGCMATRSWYTVKFLSFFFIEDSRMNLEAIAIDTDIYLYYWIYYMKPVLSRENTYDIFMKENTSISLDNLKLSKEYLINFKKQNINKVKDSIYKSANAIILLLWMPYTLLHFILIKNQNESLYQKICSNFIQKIREKKYEIIFWKKFDK